MSNSIREALTAAYDDDEKVEDSAPETEAPVEEETETPEVETPVEAIEPEETPATPEDETPVPEETDTPEPAPDQAADSPVSSRPPAGWSGEAKQKWGELPSDIQREVLRRERETSSVLRESVEARQFAGEFEKAVAPFRGFMEADGVTPMQAFGNLMQTSAGLRVGSPQQKANIVSNIIKHYGVDLETLDSMLAGETPAGNPEQDHFAKMLDERLAPVNQFMQTLEQAKAQSKEKTAQTIQNEIAAFESDPANVHFEAVREDMAVLLDTAAQQGREMGLEQAYQTAVYMNPSLRGSAPTPPVPQNGGGIPQQSLARKKLAAASVPGSRQAPSSPAPAEDLRGVLEAAWDAQNT